MTKSLSSLFFTAFFFTTGVASTGCSLYRSEGRKTLEEQARDLSGKSFVIEWQCEPHSIPGVTGEHFWEQDQYIYKLTPDHICRTFDRI